MSAGIPQQNDDRRINQYEFDAKENTLVRELATAMGFVGLAWVILGALQGVSALVAVIYDYDSASLVRAAATMIIAVAHMLTGLWVRRAGGAFGRIARTKGQDMTNLIEALGELRSAFFLQRGMLVTVIVLATLAMIARIAMSGLAA